MYSVTDTPKNLIVIIFAASWNIEKKNQYEKNSKWRIYPLLPVFGHGLKVRGKLPHHNNTQSINVQEGQTVSRVITEM